MRQILLFSIIIGCAMSGKWDTSAPLDVSPLDMTYYFYNIQNADKPVEVKSSNMDAMKETHFSGLKETMILIHGWGDSAKGLLVKTVKNEVFGGKHDLNVIGLDWSPIWKNGTIDDFRKTAAKEAGKFIADFLRLLVKDHGLKYNKLTIVGHSAGGPVSAGIGSALNGEVYNIVGLDTNTIKKTDAKFVEYIHTSRISGQEVLGHVDYFPNGGLNQTGCPDFGCNHWRAIAYYAESINSKRFVARKCDSYDDYVAYKCSEKPYGIMGGLDLDTIADGRYYLTTNGQSPYAKN